MKLSLSAIIIADFDPSYLLRNSSSIFSGFSQLITMLASCSDKVPKMIAIARPVSASSSGDPGKVPEHYFQIFKLIIVSSTERIHRFKSIDNLGIGATDAK